MPQQQIIPIWGGLNSANSPSATGLVDPVTNQQYNTGGLEVGDYFDLTEKQANALSNTATGLCHSGRYRYVLLDSGATASNVATGTVGFMRAGTFVQGVNLLTAGSGQTAGTYKVAAVVGSGGGSGAVINVVVGSAGTVTSVSVANGGFGYVSVPTFTIAAGGTPGTVAAVLNSSPNIVTSADIGLNPAATNAGIGPVRPVVFLNAITPGNYGFIQELGIATIQTTTADAVSVSNNAIVSTSSAGRLVASVTTYSQYTVGLALDAVSASAPTGTLCKVLLTTPEVQD